VRKSLHAGARGEEKRFVVHATARDAGGGTHNSSGTGNNKVGSGGGGLLCVDEVEGDRFSAVLVVKARGGEGSGDKGFIYTARFTLGGGRGA